MSGHNKWSQLRHTKGAVDQKRGAVFSKLLVAISAAAKGGVNPDFNPRLRAAIQKAKDNQVPAENIARAILRAAEAGEHLEELLLEAYGPGGIAILIEATTDNRNRTVHEIKHLLSEHNGKWAESGSVTWAFAHTADGYTAKFPQDISDADRIVLDAIISALEERDDVQNIYTNVSSQ